MKKLLTFLCVLLTYLCNSQQSFQFTSDGVKLFSAGVYDENERLVRTLFTGKVFTSGKQTVNWDGKDDLGNTAPEGKYSIQLVSGKLKAEWEGTIANTSSQIGNSQWGGSQRHFGYYGAAIDIYEHSNGSVYYTTGYSEGNVTVKKFLLSDPNKAIYLKKNATTLYAEQNNSSLQGLASTYQIASDGKTLYCTGNTWHTQKVVNGQYMWDNRVFIYAFNLSTDQMKIFPSGKSTMVNNYHYPSLIISDENLHENEVGAFMQTGIAVDDAYLYVAQAKQNKIKVYNKTTGDLITQTTAINNPRRMASDGKFLWLIYGENSIGKFAVANGVINPVPVLTLNGVSIPHSLSVATQGGIQYVYVTDGGPDQQVKRYKVSDGSADIGFFGGSNAFGQKTGYVKNAVVSDDRFFFLNRGGKLAGIHATGNGTMWVCDNGNNRMLRYDKSLAATHRLHWQGATYYLRLVENDSTRLVSFMAEYEIDYTKPLQSSWKLTRQYEPSTVEMVDPNRSFKSLVKFPNGRTYGMIRTGAAFNDGIRSGSNWFQVYELTNQGARATGIWMSGHTYSIWPDGSLMQFVSKRGGASTVIKYPLTGFDGQQNPQWAKTGVTIAHLNAIGAEGVNGGIIHRPTNDNKLIIFDPNAPNNGFQPYGLYSQGFHIGAVKYGDVTSQKWLWRTAPSTTPSYSADYPNDGKFDIGNGVKMPGGEAKTVSDFIVWNHHGEFWKQGQTNMHHLMYKNGLQLMQFGVAVSRAQNVLPKGYPGMAGNALTIATTRVGDNLFLWHGDEGYHSGIHRWKISGLNTLETFVIPLGGEQKAAPVANFSAADTVGCLTLSAKFSDRSTAGAEAITNWLWDFGDGTTSTEQHPTHLFKKSGNYTVSLKVTSQSGTTNTITKSNYIQVTEGIPVEIQGKMAVCATESVSLKGVAKTGNTADYTWRWDFGNGVIETGQNPAAKYFTKPGNYPVTLTVLDKTGCSGRADAILTVRSAPNVNAGTDVEITQGGSVRLKASGAEKYAWDNTAGLSCTSCPDPVASPGVTTQYKVTGTDAYGCSASDVVTVKVVAKVSALKIEAKNDICAGETVEIRASGADQYLWSSTGNLPKSSGSIISVTPMVSTLYKVVAKDNNGYITDTASVFINVRSLPKVNAGPDAEITQGGSVRLKASGAEKYAWDNTAGLSCTSCPDPVASPGVTTQYKVTGTDAYGCSASDVVTVKIAAAWPSALKIEAKKDICAGETVEIRASGADQYQWSSTGSLQQTSGAMITVKPTVSTLYKVVAKSNGGSTTDTASVYITVHAAPQVNAGADMAICKGEVQRLQATGAAKYTWSASPALSCTSCEGPMAAPATTTSFTVTGYSDFGCSAKDSVLLTVRQPINVTVDPVDDICIGKTVTLSARGADAYSWSPSVGVNNPAAAVTSVSPNVTTQYTVVGKDAAGCFADTAKVQVTVWAAPTVEAGEAQTLTAGQTIKLKPTYSNDVTSYRWSNSQTLNCADCPFPDAAPKNETTYRVEVANNGGCKAQDDVTIRVICSNGNLFIPNTFSPNKDGRNDNFYPRGNGIGRIKSLKIYNRSGDLVFSNENFQANNPAAGWDGRYKGQQLPSDVFLYTCEVVCSNNEVLTYKGDVTLLR